MKIGFGTAAIGRPLYINIKNDIAPKTFDLNTFKKKGIEVLEYAYEMGIRHFDTAPNYGMAEEILLKWVKEKNDASIIVSSKWGYRYIADFNPDAVEHEHKEHSLNRLKEQWEFTKQFLPHLHYYQIHSATFETGILENKEVLERLVKIRETTDTKTGITVTGDNQREVLEKALALNIFDSYQVTYNVLEQNLHEIINRLTKLGKTVIIKEAMANGRVFPNDNYPHYKEMYDYLGELAQKYGVGIDAIAVRFCNETLPDAMVLSGAASMKQVEENLKANDFGLDLEEINKLQSFQVKSVDYWLERKKLGWQ
ncbi:MAG: aryl-alcohol dehydrogenase-like predicted oxidoreductase [Maribacter sp.]|jgi:aryl-alcohol dehydrogenase-like predicted oxidoreductase